MSYIGIEERAKTAVELGESHFREFKSALHGPNEKKEKRPVRDIATNIAQTLIAFANADGGELLVGVEDDGTVTGIDMFNEQEINLLNEAPVSRIHKDTPIRSVIKKIININGKKVFYFSAAKSSEFIHITSDGRCLQRRDLESVPVPSEAIKFDRQDRSSREYDRQFIDAANVDDLDISLVKTVSDTILKGMSPEKCLQYLNLAEFGASKLNIRRAALLLFSKEHMKWHPRLQIRIIKVSGLSMLTGENYNVIMDEVSSGNILYLVEQAWEALRPNLVQTKIDKTARFEQKTIYPELACREALLNAIAHRDYSQEGKGIEVYIYTDRLEFKSPGALLSTIDIKDIISQKGVHQSRNTYIARVLRELGYMRELGEGMRRIYQLMSENELTPPSLHVNSESFSITLYHKPIYSEKESLYLEQFATIRPDRNIKSVLLLGMDECVFSAQDIWDAAGIVDTEEYRRLLDKLLRCGVLKHKIEKIAAKRISRDKKIPFKQFPRFAISFPKREGFSADKKTTMHESITNGVITKIYQRRNFGFIRGDNGESYFFNLKENKTKSNLEIGQRVKFTGGSGAKGLFAIEIHS
ncbi:putative DNA binding domain-containing protein [Serratia marcescens]|nr:putative DNA binding domain-containing protein [Serratia marcescens]